MYESHNEFRLFACSGLEFGL